MPGAHHISIERRVSGLAAVACKLTVVVWIARGEGVRKDRERSAEDLKKDVGARAEEGPGAASRGSNAGEDEAGERQHG